MLREDKKFNSFDGICTSQPVQSLASDSFLVEEEEIEELEELREMGKMKEVVMEVDMQMGVMMGEKQSLVGTEKKSSELQEAPEFLIKTSAPDDIR